MGSIVWDQETAEVYDATYAYEAVPSVVDPMVDLLVEFAGGGPVLEFAVGTGRIALPLSAAVCRCMASSSRRTWSSSFRESRALKRLWW